MIHKLKSNENAITLLARVNTGDKIRYCPWAFIIVVKDRGY